MKEKKLNDIETYLVYKERLDELTKLKNKLKNMVLELGIVRTKYVRYLDQNPYREERAEKEDIVKTLQKSIMDLIPDTYSK